MDYSFLMTATSSFADTGTGGQDASYTSLPTFFKSSMGPPLMIITHTFIDYYILSIAVSYRDNCGREPLDFPHRCFRPCPSVACGRLRTKP